MEDENIDEEEYQNAVVEDNLVVMQDEALLGNEANDNPEDHQNGGSPDHIKENK